MLHELVFLVHLASFAVAVGGVLYADKVGFSWFLGKVETISPRTLRTLHNVMSLSLAFLILSGLYLFWPEREYLLRQTLFFIKMGLVAALVINSFVIDNLMDVASQLPFKWIPAGQKAVLFASGAFSFACWAGSGITALLLFGL